MSARGRPAGGTGAPAASFRDVRVTYPGGIIALEGITLDLRPGELLGLAGSNGAGKSTLGRLLNGLVRPTSGRVEVDGVDTSAVPVRRLAMRVGYVFQNPGHQLWARTVAEELASGPRNMGMPPREAGVRALATASRLGLAGLMDRHPLRLGLGDRRLVALASVLAMRPSILVADEPVAGADHHSTQVIAAALRAERERGATVVCITHDLSLLAGLADRIVVLHEGRVLADGAPRQVLADSAAMDRARLVPPQVFEVSSRLPAVTGKAPALTVAELVDRLRAGPPSPGEGARDG